MELPNVVYCLTCNNKGHKNGCLICGKIKDKNTDRFDRYREDNQRVKNMSIEERKAYIAKRAEDGRVREKQLEVNRRNKEIDKSHRRMWEQLKNLQIKSTGDLPLDQKLKDKYGDWICS